LNLVSNLIPNTHKDVIQNINLDDKTKLISPIIDKVFNLIDIQNIHNTIIEINNLLVNLNSQVKPEYDIGSSFMNLIYSRFFGLSSTISLFLENEITTRNLNVI
jgi:hypothetical protein